MRDLVVFALLALPAAAQEPPSDWLESDGVLSLALPGGVARLHVDTGRVVKFHEHEGSGSVALVASGLLVIGGAGGPLAYDAAGTLRWSSAGTAAWPVRADGDLVLLRGPAPGSTAGREVAQALEAATGKVRWRKEVRKVFDRPGGRHLFVEQPEGTLLALRPATGEVAWRWRKQAKGWIDEVSPGDDRVVVALPGGSEVLDAAKGTRLARWSAPASGRVVGELLVGRQGIIASGPVVVWTLPAGAERWRGPEPRVAGGAVLLPPRVEGDQVLALEDGALRAHDLQTGAVRWTARVFDPPPGKRYGADLLVRGGMAWAAEGDAVAAIDLATGRVAWRVAREGWGSVVELPDALSVRIHGTPRLALAGGLLVHRTSRERTVLAGLDLATGEVRWTKE